MQNVLVSTDNSAIMNVAKAVVCHANVPVLLIKGEQAVTV